MPKAVMYGTWRAERGRPVAIYALRDERGRRSWLRVPGTPYFYAPCGWERDCIEDVLGRRVKIVEARLPSDVPKLREKYPWTDEADVRFPLRIAVDSGLEYWFGEPGEHLIKPRVLYLDIEVWNPGGEFPDADRPEFPVKSVQMLDSYSGAVLVKVAPGKPSKEDEEELKSFLLQAVEQFEPDIIAGWYIKDFDLPYIERRWGIRFHHAVVDLLDLYKRHVDRFGPGSLKTVAAGLGFDYENLQTRITEATDEEIEEYARHDVEALKLVDEHYGLIEICENQRFVAGALAGMCTPSQLIDAKLLRIREKPLPTKGSVRFVEKVKGAAVLQPPKGIFEGVAIFDVASMYPSIIVNNRVGESWYVPRLVTYFREMREKYRAARRDAEKRGDPSAERLARLELAAKILANAVYGQLGYPDGRLFNPAFANEVTRIGRNIIWTMKQYAEALGYRILYGDTDSVMVQVPFEEAGMLEKRINEMLRERFGPGISVKWEKYMEKMLFVGKKKRYAGIMVWKEGVETRKMYVVGFESVRSDVPAYTRETQAKLIELLLTRGKEEAQRYLRARWEAFPDAPLKDVGRPKTVDLKREYKSKFMWKEAALRAKRHGITGPVRGKYYAFHTLDGKTIALPEDYEWERGWPFRIEIDWEKQREKGFEDPLDDLINLLGVDIKWLRTGRRTVPLTWFG